MSYDNAEDEFEFASVLVNDLKSIKETLNETLIKLLIDYL